MTVSISFKAVHLAMNLREAGRGGRRQDVAVDLLMAGAIAECRLWT
jgi:hypothetical protein